MRLIAAGMSIVLMTVLGCAPGSERLETGRKVHRAQQPDVLPCTMADPPGSDMAGDSHLLQTLFDSIEEGTRVRICLPRGTYYLSHNINVVKNGPVDMVIEGAGMGETIFHTLEGHHTDGYPNLFRVVSNDHDVKLALRRMTLRAGGKIDTGGNLSHLLQVIPSFEHPPSGGNTDCEGKNRVHRTTLNVDSVAFDGNGFSITGLHLDVLAAKNLDVTIRDSRFTNFSQDRFQSVAILADWVVGGGSPGYCFPDGDDQPARFLMENTTIDGSMIGFTINDSSNASFEVRGSTFRNTRVGASVSRGWALSDPGWVTVDVKETTFETVGPGGLWGTEPAGGVALYNPGPLSAPFQATVTESSFATKGDEPVGHAILYWRLQDSVVEENTFTGDEVDARIALFDTTGTRVEANRMRRRSGSNCDVLLAPEADNIVGSSGTVCR